MKNALDNWYYLLLDSLRKNFVEFMKFGVVLFFNVYNTNHEEFSVISFQFLRNARKYCSSTI